MAGTLDNPNASATDAVHERRRLLAKLPVAVVVRLAERKIETSQLLSIAPGSLITFNKSCEAPLDLYVNNRLFARGEAVKIGEKFGLKIDAVGVSEEADGRRA